MKLPRSQLLVMLGVIAIVLGVTVYQTGVRFPPPQLIPEPAPTHSSGDAARETEPRTLMRAEGAIFQQRNGEIYGFRAFVPEPSLRIDVVDDSDWVLELHNIHPQATLVASESVKETRSNLKRRITGGPGGPRTIRLTWEFPKRDSYRFVAIGDTGGGTELEWTLRRGAELGADFYLHLGDFNYVEPDYDSAIQLFNAAAIPSYVAIGNHDFHVGLRSVHRKFTRHLGPKNATFTLGGVQFVNLDTAVPFWPKEAGARGAFLAGLEADPDAADFVVFTHKPFADPDVAKDGSDHRLNSREGDWLRAELLRRGMNTLLAGHIHIKAEFDDRGLRTLISGQGLAHADYIFGHPVAEILVGDVAAGQPVSYRWEPLNMPVAAHCSPRGWEVLDALGKTELKSSLERTCAK